LLLGVSEASLFLFSALDPCLLSLCSVTTASLFFCTVPVGRLHPLVVLPFFEQLSGLLLLRLQPEGG
jgi:hypothetical protein